VARQVIGVCDEALSKLPPLDDKLRGQATDYSDLKVGHTIFEIYFLLPNSNPKSQKSNYFQFYTPLTCQASHVYVVAH
jgi:hypothetical protein